MAVSRINEAGLNVNQYGNRNFIINGAMQVAQRGTSSAGVGATNNAYPTCDRWEIETANSAGRATMTQESDGPDGFANSLKLACTTADTSVAADEVFRLQQVIEAQNLQSLAKGTSSAKQFTLSFYVKGNAAATYNIEIYDLDNTRHICASFNVTTSWNRISLTFAGDTTGAINDDNGGGFQVGIYLHEGSNYTSGTLATSWASVTNANRSSSSNTSFFDSTSRTFFITGVQLEAGDTATDFEHRTFGDQLQACERYYQKLLKHGDASDGGSTCLGAAGVMYSSSYMAAPFNFKTTMRASPTLISANSTGCFKFYRNSSNDVFDDFSTGTARSPYSLELYNNSDISGTAGQAGFIYAINSNATLAVDAEL
jgi:hypothetical protein